MSTHDSSRGLRAAPQALRQYARPLLDGARDPVDGCLQPGDGPGHGLCLRDTDAEEHRLS